MGAVVEERVLAGTVEVPVRRIRWRRSIRIIPSRFPPIHLFERAAGREDFDALYELEALTNDRLRNEVGEIRRVAPEDCVYGPGSSYVMAPFTHPNPDGGRFSNATFGAYYAARERATAVAETRYHRARFLAYTSEPPMEIEMRVLEARLDARLHDLRGMRTDLPRIHDAGDYTISQIFARRVRAAGSWGIAYESVRHAGGECTGILRPKALSQCRQAEHLVYVWDGRAIVDVYEKRVYRP